MIIKLLKLTKSNRKNLFLSYLCSILSVIFQLGFIYLIFESIYANNFSFNIIVILVILGIAISILRYLEQYLGHLVAFKLLSDLRIVVYRKMRELAPAKLDNSNSGELIKLISNDIEMVEVFFAHTIVPVLVALSTVLMVSGYFATISFDLFFVSLLVYCISFIFPFFKQKKLDRINKELAQQKGITKKSIIEIVRGKRELKSFGLYNKFLDNLKEGLKKENHAQKENAVILNEKHTLFFIVISLIVLFIGRENKLSLILLIFSTEPILALSRLSISLNKAIISASNLFDFLEEKSSISFGNNHIDKIENIEIENLTFGYTDSQKVLEDVNINISKGDIIGIKGKSGIGKSTLVKLIMRWYQYKFGDICFNEHSVQEFSKNSIRSKINYIGQSPEIFEGSLRENITLRKDIHDEVIISTLNLLKIGKQYNNFKEGLETKISPTNPKFSSGELQRIELARALIHKSDLLILDEPTSNTDFENEKLMLDVLKTNYRGTVILISHRDTSLEICNKKFEIIDRKFVTIK